MEEIISAQKFEEAAADLLNANIIARDLGLRAGFAWLADDRYEAFRTKYAYEREAQADALFAGPSPRYKFNLQTLV